jgi:rod shape-determining protein MreD
VILTPKIIARLVALGIATAILQVTFFSKIELFGASPDGAVLVVMILGLVGGSVSGAVGGFSIGLLIDCLLLETMGAFAASLMAVGYASGRYRESVGGPNRAALPILGGAMTLLGLLAFAAIQVGIGVDAEVSSRVIGDALVKTLLGAALALPVYLLVRLVLRPALVEDRPSGRRPSAPRAAGT